MSEITNYTSTPVAEGGQVDNKYRMTVERAQPPRNQPPQQHRCCSDRSCSECWDADAETVDIKIDPTGNWIEIVDDGIGMSVDDMNGEYPRVGYRRRDEDVEYGKGTEKGRPVMGRKGLDKLSLFSIANVIEVESAKDGVGHGLRMTVAGIHESVQKKEPFYSPDSLPANEITAVKGIRGAHEAYSAYIEKSKALDKLQKIVDRI